MNPYWGKNFWEFFGIFFNRMLQAIKGNLSLDQLASDEVQMLVLICVAFSSSLIGVFLVLKKMTMLANSLSHTILLGVVLAYILFSPFSVVAAGETPSLNIEILLCAALITGLMTALLTQLFTHLLKIQEDASIGLVFTTLFALGIMIVTVFTRNAHIGTEVVMGNVDALHLNDLKLIFIVALANLLIITLLFKEFQITTFDGALAKSLGISTAFFNYLLMVQTAGTAIGSFRAVGVLLVLAFLVGPVLTARLLTDRLKPLILYSIGIGSLAAIVGVALSRHMLSVYQMPLSTAGLVVAVIGFFYLLALLFSPRYGILFSALRRKAVRFNNKG